MSIKLKGSSDGSVSLDAPADTSPTGTDVTFVLPTADGTSGQVLTTNGSGALSFANEGKVMQVVNGSSNQTANVASSSNTYVDTGMFDVSITPVVAGSKIIVEFSGYHPHINAANNNFGIAFKIYRNVNSAGWVDASTNHIEGYYEQAGDSNEWFDYSGRSKIVDSPTYTLGNSINYKLYFRQSSRNVTAAYAHHIGGLQTYTDAARISYILTEVAA